MNCFTMGIERFRKIGLIIVILEPMMLLQIKIIYGKNSQSSTGDAEIHSTDPVPKITISEATKRHYNYTEQLLTDCTDNGNDEWCEIEERTSGVTDTLLQGPDMTENVENIITFAPVEGNKLFGIIIDKDSEFLSFPSIYCGKTRADN